MDAGYSPAHVSVPITHTFENTGIIVGVTFHSIVLLVFPVIFITSWCVNEGILDVVCVSKKVLNVDVGVTIIASVDISISV